MSTSEREIVISHALSDSTNLGLALDVAFAFEEIRSDIIRSALKKLEAQLKEAMGEQALEVENQFEESLSESYTGFWIRNRAWPEKLWLGIEAQARVARNFCIGVSSGNYEIDRNQLKADLEQGLRRPTNSTGDWISWHWLDSQLRSWDNKKVLLDFFENGPAAQELVRLFKERIAIIDAWTGASRDLDDLGTGLEGSEPELA